MVIKVDSEKADGLLATSLDMAALLDKVWVDFLILYNNRVFSITGK